MSGEPLKLAIVAGEESGDLLAADLVDALAARSGRPVELVGVGGRHLEGRGLAPLFPGHEIALMGVSAVIRDLPRLVRRIDTTAQAVVRAGPDCLVTVDSPDFSLRVAKKVRAADPSIPIVHYVCPSVWAWRPGRARTMKGFVDEILCILPFETEELARLGGPKGTFVGHRLSREPSLVAAASGREARRAGASGQPWKLLVLPGSRRSEVKRLVAPFGETVRELAARGNSFEVTIPTVPHVAGLVREAVAGWAVVPRLAETPNEKAEAFAAADAALAASGTVALELALARVPAISCYKLDPLMAPLIKRVMTAWSASLPNLIAGWPVIPEFYDEYVVPAYLARLIEKLWQDGPVRDAQLAGFDEVARRLATGRPSGELAAERVLALSRQRLAIGT